MKNFIYLLILICVGLLFSSQAKAVIGNPCTDHSSCRLETGEIAPSEVCTGGKCQFGANPEVYNQLPSGPLNIQEWVDAISNWVSIVAGAMAVGGIIFAGMYYSTAGGSEQRQKNSKTILKYSIIGGVIIMMAWAIIQFIMTVLSEGPPPAPTL